MNLKGEHMNATYAGLRLAVGMTPAVICLTFDKIPHPLTRNIVRSLCALFGAATVKTVVGQLRSALQASPWRTGQCYQMKVPNGGRFIATSARNCA